MLIGDNVKLNNTLLTNDIIQVEEAKSTVNSRSNIQQSIERKNKSQYSSQRRNSLTVESREDSDDDQPEKKAVLDDGNIKKQKLSL